MDRLDDKKIVVEPEIAWPETGQRYADRAVSNRFLTITEVRRQDSAGRNVIGRVRDGLLEAKIGEMDYACDMQVFSVVWRRL